MILHADIKILKRRKPADLNGAVKQLTDFCIFMNQELSTASAVTSNVIISSFFKSFFT